MIDDYLTVRSDSPRFEPPFVLGDTGLSLQSDTAALSAFEYWLSANCIPTPACSVLERGLHISGLTGLIRAFQSDSARCGVAAVWILARSEQGLLSLVVRKASGACALQLHDDATLAVRQACRYMATTAVVLVQSSCMGERAPGYGRFAQDLGLHRIQENQIYAMRHTQAGVMLGHGWLTALTD